MKFREFHARITTNIKKYLALQQNKEKNEIHTIPRQNKKRYESLSIPLQNHENHEILRIPCLNNEIY